MKSLYTVFFKAQTKCGRKFLSSTTVMATSKEDAAAEAAKHTEILVSVTSVMLGR